MSVKGSDDPRRDQDSCDPKSNSSGLDPFSEEMAQEFVDEAIQRAYNEVQDPDESI